MIFDCFCDKRFQTRIELSLEFVKNPEHETKDFLSSVKTILLILSEWPFSTNFSLVFLRLYKIMVFSVLAKTILLLFRMAQLVNW